LAAFDLAIPHFHRVGTQHHPLMRNEPTPLIELSPLADATRVASVLVKDEGQRPLGNFKVLGGMTAGLRALARARTPPPHRLLCASDGNHGLAVAAAAKHAGAEAWIYLPSHVGRERTARIEYAGGRVIRVSGTYDAAVIAAREAALRGEGILIPDTTQERDDPVVADVMAGYLLITEELQSQLERMPTHAIIQAGVGGLAAAMAQGLARIAPSPVRIIIAEPATAACVSAALRAQRPVQIAGDLRTCADMLACGLASAPALEMLMRHDAASIELDELDLREAPAALARAGGPRTTPSGAAGLAALLRIAADATLRAQYALVAESRVLFLATEAAELRQQLRPLRLHANRNDMEVRTPYALRVDDCNVTQDHALLA
jgi:diaminopropionate ammonia-lyase